MKLKKWTIKGWGLGIFALIGFCAATTYSAESLPVGSKMPGFEIKGPASPQVKAYLGVNNEKLFALSQVNSKIILVEFFDVFCPVCQKTAPLLNRVYNLIKEDKMLSKDVKMIGIGIGTQPEFLPTYIKTFKVEFPLFTDPNKEINDKLKLQGVPHTVLVGKNGKILMSHIGKIENFDAFVGEIKKNYKTQ